MNRILHIIHELSGGGAAREMLNVAKHLDGAQGYEHRIIALKPMGAHGQILANEAGIDVIEHLSREQICREMERADIVQVEWWNASLVTPFLFQPFPPCRLVIRYHVAGDKAPHIVTPDHLKLADVNILSKCDNPVLKEFDEPWKGERVECILHGSDLKRMPEVRQRPHDHFNVGYIGTVDFVKMHPDYVSMSHRIDIPDVRFIVCGSVAEPSLIEQVKRVHGERKFQFKGYVEHLEDVIAEMDVFGYPLCPDTYASTELVLQEVMYARIPPVVLPHGGVPQTVHHNQNGYVVDNAEDYARAIEYLYRHPKERKRLGIAARKYVKKYLGIQNTAEQYARVYERLLAREKMHHSWGQDRRPVSKQASGPVPSDRSTFDAARSFFTSLGEAGRLFQVSYEGGPVDAVLRADIMIKNSSYVLAKNGVLSFRNLYPEDPYLNMWAGLCLEGMGNPKSAAVCYSVAISKGLADWRVYWYLAHTLELLGEQHKANQLLGQIRNVVPNLNQLIQHHGEISRDIRENHQEMTASPTGI